MKNKNKPWLDERGNSLSTEVLKEISKHWNAGVWEEYLKTLETEIRGLQSFARSFDKKCDSASFSIWDQISDHAPNDLTEAVQSALSKLTEKQRVVIQKYFFEGKSYGEIADELGKAKSTIHEIEQSALAQIKRHLESYPNDLSLMREQEIPSCFKQILKEVAA